MPKYEVGNMWSAYEKADLFLFTSNGTVSRKTDRLVMGAGIALQVRDRFPQISEDFGKLLHADLQTRNCMPNYLNMSLHRYGLLIHSQWPNCKIGAFQVKHNFSDNATLDLIRLSTKMLADWCQQHSMLSVHLNFPGIGHGGLFNQEQEIKNILTVLPPTVIIWKYKP